MFPTRSEVLAARQTWIDFLRQPERKKAKRQLSKGGERRCCLGHACQALDPKRVSGWRNGDSSLPNALVVRLGMWNHIGLAGDLVRLRDNDRHDLADLNDETNISPQKVGDYLATVIEGGDDTPFKPLSDFPEAQP